MDTSLTTRIPLRAWMAALIWSSAVAASLAWSVYHQQQHTREMMRMEARAYLAKDTLFRGWVAERSGIYVATPDGAGDPERIDHAYIASRLDARAARALHVRFELFGVESAAAPWKREALRSFRSGRREVDRRTTIEGEPYLRLTRAVTAERSCLECHADFRAGELRGGASVAVPAAPYLAMEHDELWRLALAHGGLWLVGLVGIHFGSRQLARHERQRAEAEAARRRARTQLAHAQRIASLGSWEWNVARGTLLLSDEAAHILGRPPDHPLIDLDSFLNHVEAEDRERVREALEGSAAAGGTHSAEFRIHRSDGETRHLLARWEAGSGEGEARHVLGTMLDITARKQAEAEIERAYHAQRVLGGMLHLTLEPLPLREALSRSLELLLSSPSFTLLRQGAIFTAGGEEERLELIAHRGLEPELQQACAVLPFGKCLCGRTAQRRELIFASHVDAEHEIRPEGMHDHGHYCVPILSGGELLGVLNTYVPAGYVRRAEDEAFLRMVAETLALMIRHKRTEARLQRLAHNDPLTGLPNRALLFDRLDQALARAHRYRHRLAVLFLDLDGFKQINDTLGHEGGDLVLREVGRRLKGCVRGSDTAARVGGDEFVFVVNDVLNAESAATVAHKILAALSRRFVVRDAPYEISASIGIALYPDSAQEGEELVRLADEAMYRAKADGGKRHRFHGG